MPRVKATAGQILINSHLPSSMRDYRRVLDKKGLDGLLEEIAEKHPEKYREISARLQDIGKDASYTTNGNSFGLSHLRKSLWARKRQLAVNKKIKSLLGDNLLTDKRRNEEIIKIVGKMSNEQHDHILEESLAANNPLAIQIMSGARGNKVNLSSLRGSDGLYEDHRFKTIPIPVMRSYSEGLTPLEYWAGTYGARQGVSATKFATRDAGFLSKQLNQVAHRTMVTALDRDKDSVTLQGLPVDVSDDESEGSLLAYASAGYKRNTILTPKILRSMRKQGVKRILIRSPLVSGSPDGGIYARDAGVREKGRLPSIGDNIGLAAAQALSEPLSQSQLSAKHTGGIAGESKAVSGFEYINQLVQVPKIFKGGAAHSIIDGKVQNIEEAPAGGSYVTINNEKHYVGSGYDVKVKIGEDIEAGDVISEGTPNPALVTKYKGIGEGRRYFVSAFYDAMRDAGIKTHRRNVEVLSRGLINHVKLTSEMGDFAPDDIVPYSTLEHRYKPRTGFKSLKPKAAVGKYLERPYLHYSIGTRVRPSMLKEFGEFGVGEVDVHEEEPPFEAQMVRGMQNLQHDPDWVTRMFGSGLKSGLLRGVHRGGTSTTSGTSFVPGLAKAVDFGRTGIIKTPTR
jgi:DNA-directed RNA polymerase subunit beta'